MKRISYLETCHPRNLLSGIHAFVLRLDSRLRGNDSEVVSLHASRFTRCVCFIVLLFSLHASHFTLHAQAALENGMEADVVLGQPDFNVNISNNGGVSSRSFSSQSFDMFTDGNQLFVTDFNVSRILVFNQIPTKNQTAADIVLGQPDFVTSVGQPTSAMNFGNPISVHSDGIRLFVSNHNADRVLIFNSIPTTNFAPADVVLGQQLFTTVVANLGGLSARSLRSPRDIESDGQRLIIADTGNNRVLIHNSIPSANFAAADVVVGQPGFTTDTANLGGVSARTMSNPVGLTTDGERLIVLDNSNFRILIWNKIPTQNGQAPDVVLGQPDFESNIRNNGGVSARSLNPLNGTVHTNGKILSVGDAGNNRVLIWKEIPKTNFAPADFVLGQPDFNSNTANAGGVSARTLSGPRGTFFDGSRFYVVDDNNARVLIYNVTDSAFDDLGPQFSQGKAVIGKVFWDWDGDGRQDHFGSPSQELRRARPASQARRQDA